MTSEEAKSCIGTIEMLQRLAYNIHGVMDVIDADNCKKIIKAIKREPMEDATLIDIFCMGCEYKEQDPILDKIRAEIARLRDSWEKDNYHDEADALTTALAILDKYKVQEDKHDSR